MEKQQNKGNVNVKTGQNKAILGQICKNYNEENTKKSIDLSNEQISFIIQKCEYEIEENEDLIKDLKDKKVISDWTEENCFISNLIKDIKQNFYDKIGTQIVIQSLTPQQEDFIFETGLERYREAQEQEAERNEARADLCRKNEENNIIFED